MRRLVWDDWNLEHIARRNISPTDIGWLLSNEDPRPLFLGGRGGTLSALGKDAAGRYLIVILARRGRGAFYPVTARPMTSIEKHHYLRRRK